MFPSATCGRGRFAFPAAFPVGIRPFRTAGHLRQGAVNEACCRVKWRLYHYTLICQFKNRLFRPDSTMRAGRSMLCSLFVRDFLLLRPPSPHSPKRSEKDVDQKRNRKTPSWCGSRKRKAARTHAIRRPDHRIRPSGAPCPAQKHPQNARTNRGHPRKRQDQHRRA